MGLIDAYATDSVTVTGRGTLGTDGRYDYDGTAVSTTARVRMASGLRHNIGNEEYVYRIKVWLKPSVTVVKGDRLTHGGINYEVRDIVERDGVDGQLDHYEVYCG